MELLGDADGQVVIPAGKKLTLDLDGKTITYSGTAIINNGTLIVKNGAVVSTGNCGIGVGNNSETTILSDVTVTAQESAVITSTSTGAKIYIEGGTFTSTDNAVIAGNGSAREGEPNTIVINGGTFNGGITTAGYVACGIYAPWKDEITVKGGTFNITGGAGIVARAGQVTVDGGTFYCTGNVTGKVGDSRVVVPCAALVFDSEANYPALTGESVILVKSGSFTVQSGVAVAQAVKAENDLNPRISIKGGSFSSDPSEYVADGYIARENNGKYVVSMVGTAENPYTLNEFNALTKLPEGRDKLYVDIGDTSVTGFGKCATVGNYKLSDQYIWVNDSEAAPAGYTATDRKNTQNNTTAYRTNKDGITLYVLGTLTMENYNNNNFSGFQTLCFQLPEKSTVILKGVTLRGSFNISGSYTYMYNLSDGSIGHLQNPVPEGYTNVWYGFPFVIENIKLIDCTINGQWFTNGNVAKNVEIEG